MSQKTLQMSQSQKKYGEKSKKKHLDIGLLEKKNICTSLRDIIN